MLRNWLFTASNKLCRKRLTKIMFNYVQYQHKKKYLKLENHHMFKILLKH